MKLTSQDWKTLRVPLIVLGMSAFAMVLLFYFTDDQKTTTEQKALSEQTQLFQARQKFQTSGQEKEVIIKYLPIYQQLIKDGFIGEERRIEWVDSLRTIHQDKKLFSIKYTIDPQEDYKPDFTLNLGTFNLRRSTMKVELSMLHEMDILTLINALDEMQTTPYILRDCEIIRQNTAFANVLAPNMLATCAFDWLTIHEPETKPVAP